jgi:hypothetical protein
VVDSQRGRFPDVPLHPNLLPSPWARTPRGHGHVIPRPDGTKARCAGPSGGCWTCYLEDLVWNRAAGAVVMEGFNLKPGDKLLLVADPRMPPDQMIEYVDQLKRRFPEVEITVMTGFTGVQVHADEGKIH